MHLDIAYIGTSPVALELLCWHKGFNLTSYLCEKKRLTSRCEEIASKNKIKILTFDSKEELYNQLEKLMLSIDIFIIYQFDYILPLKFAATNKFFNFHSGSLLTNRGAHPIIRSILNGDKQTELTLHRINEKIDQGLVIGTFGVAITNDDAVSLKEKTEAGIIPLLEKLLLYLNGMLQPVSISEGQYYKPICEEDYKINLECDTEKTIINKIRSQKQYKGALVEVEGIRYYVISLKKIENLSQTINVVKVNDDSIDVYRKDVNFKLIFNK
jgi:methionyl-tRNA formyltransferase